MTHKKSRLESGVLSLRQERTGGSNPWVLGKKEAGAWTPISLGDSMLGLNPES